MKSKLNFHIIFYSEGTIEVLINKKVYKGEGLDEAVCQRITRMKSGKALTYLKKFVELCPQ